MLRLILSLLLVLLLLVLRCYSSALVVSPPQRSGRRLSADGKAHHTGGRLFFPAVQQMRGIIMDKCSGKRVL